MKKIIGVVLFIISGIPLLAYPFALLADIMSLAGERSGNNANMLLEIVMVLFIIANSTYLLTYIASLIFFIRKKGASILISTIPYIHFSIVVLLGDLWNYLENKV